MSASARLSLPPLLNDQIQGRLDFMILKPILLPPLPSHLGIKFQFKWWGSNRLIDSRLNPDGEDVKEVFDICCNYKGLQKYLEDIKAFEIEVYVESENLISEEEPKSCARFTRQLRTVKEWKTGDYVGKIKLSNLKLNARGEFIKESNIVNVYGDYVGSLIVFMLFTSEELNGYSLENDSFKEKSRTYGKKSDESNLLYSSKCFNNSLSNEKVKIDYEIYKDSDKKESEVDCKNFNDMSLTSSCCVQGLGYKINENFTLSRIFSFLDSGAIKPCDVPTLIQISQGRSPSIERSSFHFDENFTPGLYSEDKGGSELFNTTAIDQGPSFNSCSEMGLSEKLQDSKPEKLNEHNFEPLLKDNKERETMQKPVDEFETLQWVHPEDVSVNEKENDIGIFILNFHSMKFQKEEETNGSFKNSKNKSQRIVHQRSQYCYFIEAFLEYEGEEEGQSALFLSRRLIDKEVIFNARHMFHLREMDVQKHDGTLRFKISLRKLGNRCRKEVGSGSISLLHALNYGNTKPILLPAKLTNSGTPLCVVPYVVLRFSVVVSPLKSQKLFPDQQSLCNDSESRDEDRRDHLLCDKDEDLGTQSRKDLREREEDRNEFFQEVHLEILEGNNLPLLWSKKRNKTFAPNGYVVVNVGEVIQTGVVKSSSSPKWNFTYDFVLRYEAMKRTNFLLIMKLLHCVEGSWPSQEDPMLGFASVDTSFLWKSIVSLCGWIPVLNVDGDICGELKVSLTSKRSRWRWKLPVEEEGPNSVNSVPKTFVFPEDVSVQDNEADVKDNVPHLKHNPSEEELMQNAPNCASDDAVRPFKRPTDNNDPDNENRVPTRREKSRDPHPDAPSKVNPVIESLQWMNHLNLHDSPCASYLDLGPLVTGEECGDGPSQSTRPKKPLSSSMKLRKKRLRIAANLNFSLQNSQ